ncbi:MAG: glutamine-hydrolyzing carbamoyl-phosphate synthase small subunit [Deltaproteobacteria bacterium]|nr:glutamine-hydrolyzing carbamoyl-phosphate synthase small subunit [Deltaproteobacteria bacterium]
MKRGAAYLALADGTFFEGEQFGATGESFGEVVFNTSLSGYQEILTDPSYRGQIIAMTCPQIGNVGVNPEDMESDRVQCSGFIVKEYYEQPSNFRARNTLGSFLEQAGVVGISGIDTRALVKHIRTVGAQMGLISTIDSSRESLVAKAKAAPPLVGRDLVKDVTCTSRYEWKEGSWVRGEGFKNVRTDFHVVAYDFGIKRNILRGMVDSGMRVTVVPAATQAAEALALKPDGIFLSNGPGDPEAVPYAYETVSSLLGKVPIFGICLGHQMLALSVGGSTYKLKFGHRGGNQPVMDLYTRKVEITSQNHGFAVKEESVLDKGFRISHVNLNDQTVEGLEHVSLPVFCVQYHPEASPGPHDANYLFGRFRKLIERQ